jgi:hypothetical protein
MFNQDYHDVKVKFVLLSVTFDTVVSLEPVQRSALPSPLTNTSVLRIQYH